MYPEFVDLNEYQNFKTDPTLLLVTYLDFQYGL
jgi:hypothetical protein